MPDENPPNDSRIVTVPELKIDVEALAKALKLPEIGEGFRCLIEGPKDPEEMAELPKGFRVSAWQQIDDPQEPRKLGLKVDGPQGAAWNVEVCLEDTDSLNADKKVFREQSLKAGQQVLFDLPPVWVEDPGPRFVTVYLRVPGAVAKTKVQEAPTTIIRIIPAPVRQGATDEFSELASPADAD